MYSFQRFACNFINKLQVMKLPFSGIEGLISRFVKHQLSGGLIFTKEDYPRNTGDV